MKKIIKLLLKVIKTEWKKPKESCICESKIINRLFMMIPVFYFILEFYFPFSSFEDIRVLIVFGKISGVLLVCFVFLMAMFMSFLSSEKTRMMTLLKSFEETEMELSSVRKSIRNLAILSLISLVFLFVFTVLGVILK